MISPYCLSSLTLHICTNIQHNDRAKVQQPLHQHINDSIHLKRLLTKIDNVKHFERLVIGNSTQQQAIRTGTHPHHLPCRRPLHSRNLIPVTITVHCTKYTIYPGMQSLNYSRAITVNKSFTCSLTRECSGCRISFLVLEFFPIK